MQAKALRSDVLQYDGCVWSINSNACVICGFAFTLLPFAILFYFVSFVSDFTNAGKVIFYFYLHFLFKWFMRD